MTMFKFNAVVLFAVGALGFGPVAKAAPRDPLQGSWRVVSIGEGEKAVKPDPKEPWVIEIDGGTLTMPYKEAGNVWKQRVYKIATDPTKTPKTIDLITPNDPVGRGIYEFTVPTACAKCHADLNAARKGLLPKLADVCDPELKTTKLGLRLALSVDGARPATFGGKGVIVFEMTPVVVAEKESPEARLRLAIETAEREKLRATEALADLLLAQARTAAEVAKEPSTATEKSLAAARAKLKEAQEVVADLENLRPAEDFVIVRVRLPKEGEKAIRLRPTGKETISTALASAGESVPGLSAEAEVWVVRAGEIVPPILTKKRDFALEAGDQLFVQVKAEK